MAKVFIEESTLTKIGNSIRNKTGKSDLIDPAVMDVEIDSIVSGGDLPEEALTITGNCQQRFTYNGWNWYVNALGDRVVTENITSMFQMFTQSGEITKIPFTININCRTMDGAFASCYVLEECPKIRGNLICDGSTSLGSALQHCRKLRDVEDFLDPAMLDSFSAFKVTSAYSSPKVNQILDGCHSLRRVPTWFYKLKLNEESTSFPAQYYTLYYSMFSNCHSLDEALNIPVWTCNASLTSNIFTSSFQNASRLKNFTFETQEDGTPYTANWKSQVIDLSSYVGWTNSHTYVTNYNSGITKDKEVKNLEQYNTLKDDPDWFTRLSTFSRYNHDSAVATINSLPDTSAYLASAGGTNTIKFTSGAGDYTDGRAISQLTEEEIAVATAKGWTVALV